MPLVLFLVFGVFEFGRFYYTRLTLQHAVAEAARFAVTGNVLPDSLGNPMTRAASIRRVIAASAQTLDVNLDRIQLSPEDGGGPGDVVRVSAVFTFRFVAPGYAQFARDGSVEIHVSTAMKNESFTPSGASP
jgi:Flp pilus assembly protein TadG